MKTATTKKTKVLRKSLKQKSDTKSNDDSNRGGGTQTDTQSVEEIQTEGTQSESDHETES